MPKKFKLHLGHDSSHHPVLWNCSANNHICITGQPGTGKSVMNTRIAQELVNQGAHCVFLDSANEYGCNSAGKPVDWPPGYARLLDIRSPEVPVCDFHLIRLDDGGFEHPRDAANRIADMLKVTMKLGVVQTGYIAEKFAEDFDRSGRSSIASLIDHIKENIEEKEPVAKALRYRFNQFLSFPASDAASLTAFQEPGITIINTQPITTAALVSPVQELLLSNLWTYKTRNPGACPLVFLVDECQHWSFDPKLMLHKILAEGRKYSISGCLSSQSIDLKRMGILGYADLHIFFRPGYNGLDYAIRSLTQTCPNERNHCKRDLGELLPGEFLIRGANGPVWGSAKTKIQ